MSIGQKLLFSLLPALFAFSGFSQAKFSLSVDPPRVPRDGEIELTLTVANSSAVQNIVPPSLNDFLVTDGPAQVQQINSVNGVTQQSTSVVYHLQPKHPGEFKLGPAVAIVEGHRLQSNTAAVSVSNKSGGNPRPSNNLSSLFSMSGPDPFASAAPQEAYNDFILRRGESIPEKVNRNMQLRLETDKTSVYVGEPVLATYKLYSRLKSESTLSKNPSFNGFSVVDMTQQDSEAHDVEKLNGRPYNVYVIRKAQLYPLQAGSVTLEPATLDNKIDFLRADAANDAFPGANDIITQNVSLSSKPVTIPVKPLPETGKPANFNGAVGTFSIEAALPKDSISTDESGKLFVTVTGKGNMQMLTLPEIHWPAGIEGFDAKVKDNTTNTTVPVSGSKIFEIPFTVSRAGEYSLPAVALSYFNPADKQYHSVQTVPINIVVLPAAKSKGSMTAVPEHRQIPTGSILLFSLAIIAVVAGFIGWMRRSSAAQAAFVSKSDPEPETANSITTFAEKNPLAETEECLAKGDCVEFYRVLNSELREYLCTRFDLAGRLLNAKTLATAMDAAAIDNETVLQTQRLLDEINRQVYMPFEKDTRLHEMYARARALVDALSVPAVIR